MGIYIISVYSFEDKTEWQWEYFLKTLKEILFLNPLPAPVLLTNSL